MEDKYYFIKRKGEKVLWTYKPKTSQKLLYVFSNIFWVPLPILFIGLILCITKALNWSSMYLFLGLSLLSYLLAFLTSLSNKDLEYILTNKAIIILTGNSYSKIKYETIKNIKVKHSIFSKRNGSIRIYLQDKKNLFNHLNGIDNVDNVYKTISTIILDNSNSLYNL